LEQDEISRRMRHRRQKSIIRHDLSHIRSYFSQNRKKPT